MSTLYVSGIIRVFLQKRKRERDTERTGEWIFELSSGGNVHDAGV